MENIQLERLWEEKHILKMPRKEALDIGFSKDDAEFLERTGIPMLFAPHCQITYPFVSVNDAILIGYNQYELSISYSKITGYVLPVYPLHTPLTPAAR